jgi:hypothetical protein
MKATGGKYEHNKTTGITGIVIYSKSEEGKAFVHANCVFVHEARSNSSERKRRYS